MSIDTKKVANRRKLKFNSIEEVLADVNLLATKGEPKALGNWTPGQVLHHLTLVHNGAIDGMPFKTSFFLRMMAKLFKNMMLNGSMPPGFKMPKEVEKDTLINISWQNALTEFRDSILRLKNNSKREPSPFLGKMSNEEWEKLHCRHAELHLSFLQPAS